MAVNPDIDNSTNFKLSEEAIRAFRTKLSTNYSDTSDVSTPGSNGVLELHELLDRELLNLITEVQNHESSTAVNDYKMWYSREMRKHII